MSDIWQEIDCTWLNRPHKPTKAAQSLAARILMAAKATDMLPQQGATGYWPTACLVWDDGRVEVEVFDTFCELVFAPAPKSRTGNGTLPNITPPTLAGWRT